MAITVKEALRSRGAEAERVILKELSQMIGKKVWTPVHMSIFTNTEKHGIIRSQTFLKKKYLPSGEFEKLKARLVAGGNQQDKNCESDCGVKLATCWLRKRKGKTMWWNWSRKTCLLTTIK